MGYGHRTCVTAVRVRSTNLCPLILRAGAIDEADIAVEGLEAAVAALERLTQMLAYNCREEVTYGLRVRP